MVTQPKQTEVFWGGFSQIEAHSEHFSTSNEDQPLPDDDDGGGGGGGEGGVPEAGPIPGGLDETTVTAIFGDYRQFGSTPWLPASRRCSPTSNLLQTQRHGWSPSRNSATSARRTRLLAPRRVICPRACQDPRWPRKRRGRRGRRGARVGRGRGAGCCARVELWWLVIDMYRRASVENLKPLVDTDLIHVVNRLLLPAGTPFITANTYTLLICALATAATIARIARSRHCLILEHGEVTRTDDQGQGQGGAGGCSGETAGKDEEGAAPVLSMVLNRFELLHSKPALDFSGCIFGAED
ncbi:hypothetical protein C8J57DRAFT_1216495 [Mycena rebaudengoi]|nr:hypothetical protein C8J57DRAFT_1216495 [Mycena rebaudengoi]